MNINIRHLFLAFFIMWTGVVSVGRKKKHIGCVLAVLNNESGFATFFNKASLAFSFFFLYAALKIHHFHKWFGKQKCRRVTSSSETI